MLKLASRIARCPFAPEFEDMTSRHQAIGQHLSPMATRVSFPNGAAEQPAALRTGAADVLVHLHGIADQWIAVRPRTQLQLMPPASREAVVEDVPAAVP
jgi:hypothetical protein